MTVLEQLQNQLEDDLQALQQLKKHGWLVWPMSRIVKEEHAGRCCYLAEEFLSKEDLRRLKEKLGINEQQWRRFKVKIAGNR